MNRFWNSFKKQSDDLENYVCGTSGKAPRIIHHATSTMQQAVRMLVQQLIICLFNQESLEKDGFRQLL